MATASSCIQQLACAYLGIAAVPSWRCGSTLRALVAREMHIWLRSEWQMRSTLLGARAVTGRNALAWGLQVIMAEGASISSVGDVGHCVAFRDWEAVEVLAWSKPRPAHNLRYTF